MAQVHHAALCGVSAAAICCLRPTAGFIQHPDNPSLWLRVMAEAHVQTHLSQDRYAESYDAIR